MNKLDEEWRHENISNGFVDHSKKLADKVFISSLLSGVAILIYGFTFSSMIGCLGLMLVIFSLFAYVITCHCRLYKFQCEKCNVEIGSFSSDKVFAPSGELMFSCNTCLIKWHTNNLASPKK